VRSAKSGFEFRTSDFVSRGLDRREELSNRLLRQRLRPCDPRSFCDEDVRQLRSVFPGLMPFEPSENLLIALAVALK
jgi:hypothetical protein